MPPATKLSTEELREIVAARGKESAATVRKRYGIGTTRLYRIWKEDAAPKQTVEQKQAAKPTEQTSTVLHQILVNVQDLQKDMDILLEWQESHFEDVEDIDTDLSLLEEEVEETKDRILESIEKNSNAVREKTDRFVSAANVVVSAVVSVSKAAAILFLFGFVLYRPTLAFLKPDEQKGEQELEQEREQKEIAKNPPQKTQKNNRIRKIE